MDASTIRNSRKAHFVVMKQSTILYLNGPHTELISRSANTQYAASLMLEIVVEISLSVFSEIDVPKLK